MWKLSGRSTPSGQIFLFLPPIILDHAITFLGRGTEVYRDHEAGFPDEIEARWLQGNE